MIQDAKGNELKQEAEKPAEQPAETAQTDKEGQLASITVGDKQYKIVNTATAIEIVVHKLEDGTEISQIVAHEFMMADHKPYMVHLLTEAINTVMKAKRRKSMVKLASQAMINQIKRSRPRMKDMFRKRR